MDVKIPRNIQEILTYQRQVIVIGLGWWGFGSLSSGLTSMEDDIDTHNATMTSHTSEKMNLPSESEEGGWFKIFESSIG
jgi:hypothetical protein